MSTDQPPLSADPDVIRTWLSHVYADAPGFISVCSDADKWAGRRFSTDEAGLTAATEYAVKTDKRQPKGIYTQVTTLREHPAKGRGGEDLAHALTHLWADGDFGTIGHKPGPDDLPAPPDEDAVAKVVTESGLPEPSGWVHSGGGYNPVWLLSETFIISDDNRAQIKVLTTAWQTILAAQAYRCGWSWDTEVGNLDRLMKLPGTVNRKEGLERATSIGPGSGAVYGLADLVRVADDLGPAAHDLLAEASREKQARRNQRMGVKLALPASRRAPRTTVPTGDGPLDVLAEHLEFRDILEPAGFTYVGANNDGRQMWKRPAAGGESSSPYSLLCDDHVAVNFSDRSDLPVGAQPAGRKLTVPYLYAHYNYGGDVSAAASDILRAAAGRNAHGPAGSLPTAVLDEVRRRCLPDDPAPAVSALPDEPIHWGDEDEPEDPGDAPVVAETRSGFLPETFYSKRTFLTHIRAAAHSRAAPADVVLYSFLARLSGMLPHQIRAVTGIGTRASLNLFAASVGTSGAGKSTGKDCVRDLMPPADDDFRDGLPVGTGEGIAETFMGTVDEATGELHKVGPYKGDPVMRKVRKQVRHNAFFYIDEGQTLQQLQMRTGATLAETLRRAAVGETLGQTNASEERTRYIPAGSYSMGLLIGLQPGVATVLLSDTETGTPQRFWWAWSIDPTVPDEAPDWPGDLDVPVVRLKPDGPVDVTFPKRIRDELRRERVARVRGELEVAELDGHAGLMKVKMAALLALLDNRRDVNEEDWSLAEEMWACSCSVRDSLVLRAQREAEAERQRQDDAQVQRELRAHLAKSDADRSLERVAQLVKKHASQVGGITFGYLKRALASRDRPLLSKAIDLAETRDWVVVEGDRVRLKTD